MSVQVDVGPVVGALLLYATGEERTPRAAVKESDRVLGKILRKAPRRGEVVGALHGRSANYYSEFDESPADSVRSRRAYSAKLLAGRARRAHSALGERLARGNLRGAFMAAAALDDAYERMM